MVAIDIEWNLSLPGEKMQYDTSNHKILSDYRKEDYDVGFHREKDDWANQ